MTTRRLLLTLFALCALIAAGCGGSDRGEDESGGVGGGGGDGGGDTTAPAGDGAGDFGDLTGVCGPNEGGGAVPDAGPEETQGITEDSIRWGEAV